MALRLKDGSVFLHIPKTGGTWVRTALSQAGLVAGEIGHKHLDYDGLLRAERDRWGPLKPLYKGWISAGRRLGRAVEKPSVKFCTVRHPLSWYESHWKFSAREKWGGWKSWGGANSRFYWHPTSHLNDLGSMDFNEFLWNVLKKRPGFVSELFYSFTKAGIDFIGRTETLAADIAAFLNQRGLKAPRELPERANVSVLNNGEVVWDPEIRRLILKTELPALLSFGYLSEEEREEIGFRGSWPTHPALHRGS